METKIIKTTRIILLAGFTTVLLVICGYDNHEIVSEELLHNFGDWVTNNS